MVKTENNLKLYYRLPKSEAPFLIECVICKEIETAKEGVNETPNYSIEIPTEEAVWKKHVEKIEENIKEFKKQHLKCHL